MPFRELWGWRGLSPSCCQLPTHQLISLPGEVHGALTWHKWKLQQKVKPRAKPLSPLPSLLRNRPWDSQKPPPSSSSPLLTDVQAALLWFGSLQSEGRALREGERTETWRWGAKTEAGSMYEGTERTFSNSIGAESSQCCLCFVRYSQCCRAVTVSLIPAELPDTPECFGQNVWWRAEPWEVRVNPMPYRESSTRGRHSAALFPVSLWQVSPGVTHLQWGVSSLQRRTMESFPGGSGVVDMMLSLRFRRVCFERETKRCQKGYLAEMCSRFWLTAALATVLCAGCALHWEAHTEKEEKLILALQNPRALIYPSF